MIHCRRYVLFITVRDPGLFAVPTRIVSIVAPINALLTWLLGMSSLQIESESKAKRPI
jgi:hypothetical protein